MTDATVPEVRLSISRGLWGEVSTHMRSVQFRLEERVLRLRFTFDSVPTGDDLESVGSIGAEVAADLPGWKVDEEVRAIASDCAMPIEEGWHTAFRRKEPSLAH
ncbi:MAG TPA: hypothetical protein VMB73_03775 [Acetobacteraceae bacterium]|jgi:hypothetical protein|nr:hypothetical protein [Acetobacteraceae bacterium]